jgi:hypothetical protein
LNHLPDIGINLSDIISTWVQQVKEVLTESNPQHQPHFLSLIIAFAQTNSINEMRFALRAHPQFASEFGYRLGQVKTLVTCAPQQRCRRTRRSEQNLTDALVSG